MLDIVLCDLISFRGLSRMIQETRAALPQQSHSLLIQFTSLSDTNRVGTHIARAFAESRRPPPSFLLDDIHWRWFLEMSLAVDFTRLRPWQWRTGEMNAVVVLKRDIALRSGDAKG